MGLAGLGVVFETVRIGWYHFVRAVRTDPARGVGPWARSSGLRGAPAPFEQKSSTKSIQGRILGDDPVSGRMRIWPPSRVAQFDASHPRLVPQPPAKVRLQGLFRVP